ncbi:D-serine deaminase-like pyridoxal phosphate-dependent protein [Agrobacterium tumefaciens]|uniref:D-TA family PLP-dependent enzyme n=1 Tax=Agrobacterium tumefaciens TaxID=358 RepID=UPI000B40058E|nr:D-TA family PLP-dependent enzyme [Agrobacterium tumefaciens]MBP2511441.1 D-serine deaminase-like pyridoxal phosphate-dependent protein [Agrobacterium tumefaciens]MBP2597677.1 D-serine deaminase-like pyridoxal phosphate-dependent protein [Agrobacterium tumefaciens]MCW8058771.1 D-TA family PLP-dependent enzyme [Agrobacterium tumefaciens]MCW8146384.1 D-TA family PLP-dependent enzyme [Agrobacterium tumefaciens]MQB39843.1 D-TA family PLP-dependent enzyme [Agrobacterium tumefaciens]
MTYPWPDAGTPLNAISTPMPVIDEDRLSANILKAQSYLDEHGKAFRPHIKTHKIPAIAKQQLQAGAIGINCQKVSEAEVFADAGFDDILITYNILGAAKLSQLKALNARIGGLSVVADSAVTIAGLADTFEAVMPLAVLVECDTGGKRCGVQTPEAALALAEKIVAAPGLRFKGILTYPAPDGAETVENFLRKTMALLAARGIDCPVRSSGGSPDFYSAHLVPSATEHRAGTYVYNDRAMLRAGHCTAGDLAMHVLATVVSRPTADRAVLDSGSKALTSDLLGFSDYGLIEGYEGAKIVSLSEEHAVVDLSGCASGRPEIGDVVKVVPNHTCVVSNLFDRMVFHRNGVVTRVEKVTARGTVW